MNISKVFLLATLLHCASHTFAQNDPPQLPTSFLQDVSSPLDLPSEISGKIITLLYAGSHPIVVTTDGFYDFGNHQWKSISSQGLLTSATVDIKGHIWLASKDQIYDQMGNVYTNLENFIPSDTIRCLHWSGDETLYIGTTNGLFTFQKDIKPHTEIRGVRVSAITSGQENEIWVATEDGLWNISEEMTYNLDDVIMAEGHERNYYSLASINKGMQVVFGTPHSVAGISRDGNHWLWKGSDGLPFGPVKSISIQGHDTFWFGTEMGAIRKDEDWHYFHGRRWLQEDRVIDVLAINDTTAWIASPNSITQIIQREMTLEQKALHYENSILLRHQRRGLVNRSFLDTPGDLSSSRMQNEDNDGLWTATYLAAECYRYAVTGDEVAKQNAIRTFEALERLETVTGISGYPARSYASIEDSVVQSKSPHPKHWHISKDGKWRWLDDTSSDEITGHMFSISLFCDLVAPTALRERAVRLMTRIVDNIVDNGLCLIDADEKPTRWGIWTPDSLNHSANWAYERGLNSLQILSFLKTIYHFTGHERFQHTYQLLVENHGYTKNALNAKVFGPFEVSHSDDILNFLPYYGLMKYAKEDPYFPIFEKSLRRTWEVVQDDHMPVWNVMSSAWLGQDCDLNVAKEELETYPLDLIDWRVSNGHRWDLQFDKMVDRSRRRQAISPIRAPENQIFRWNTNPKLLDGGSGGKREVMGTYFLVAYWMARYHGYFD